MKNESTTLEEIYNLSWRYYAEISGEIQDCDSWEMGFNAYFSGNPLSRWLFLQRLKVASNLFPMERGEIPLDFGCGPGIFTALLGSRFRRVYASDLNPNHARGLLTHLGIDNAEILDTDELERRETGLGITAIFALDVLEHVEDPDPFLFRFFRLLPPGGKFIICGPTENWLYKIGRKMVRFPGDYHFRGIGEIIERVPKAMFQLVTTRHLPLPGPTSLFVLAGFERG